MCLQHKTDTQNVCHSEKAVSNCAISGNDDEGDDEKKEQKKIG